MKKQLRKIVNDFEKEMGNPPSRKHYVAGCRQIKEAVWNNNLLTREAIHYIAALLLLEE